MTRNQPTWRQHWGNNVKPLLVLYSCDTLHVIKCFYFHRIHSQELTRSFEISTFNLKAAVSSPRVQTPPSRVKISLQRPEVFKMPSPSRPLQMVQKSTSSRLEPTALGNEISTSTAQAQPWQDATLGGQFVRNLIDSAIFPLTGSRLSGLKPVFLVGIGTRPFLVISIFFGPSSKE